MRRYNSMTRLILSLITVFGLLAVLFCPVSAAKSNPKVIMKTTKGDIVIELFEDKAPISVKNFLDYVDSGFYRGTIFHRVIKDFMVQGGGLTADLVEKPVKPPIKNEAANGLSNKRGTIAMARTDVVDSATAQFYFNHVDNQYLDHRDKTPNGYGYAVFGKVIKGMEVIDAIANVRVGTSSVPRETITIISVERVE
jgi:cyclophilin family peptidyl-prolyl cis-trans isomerase